MNLQRYLADAAEVGSIQSGAANISDVAVSHSNGLGTQLKFVPHRCIRCAGPHDIGHRKRFASPTECGVVENSYRLGPDERTILRMIEQAGDQAGHLTVDRILRRGDISPNRVRDLVLAGCCELCDHPTERDPHDKPLCAVCITEQGRIALTQPFRFH